MPVSLKRKAQQPAKITSIIKASKETDEAAAGSPVTVTLDRDIDISRGDVITDSETLRKTDSIEAKIIWLDDEPLDYNGMPVDMISYTVTLKNNGEKDFTWSDEGEGYGLLVYVVYRDGDGNIIGGTMAFDENGGSGNTIAAGEELVLKMSAPVPEGVKTELYPVVN